MTLEDDMKAEIEKLEKEKKEAYLGHEQYWLSADNKLTQAKSNLKALQSARRKLEERIMTHKNPEINCPRCQRMFIAIGVVSKLDIRDRIKEVLGSDY